MADRPGQQRARKSRVNPEHALGLGPAGVVLVANAVQHILLIVGPMPIDDQHVLEVHAIEENPENVAHNQPKHLFAEIGAGHGIIGKVHALHERLAVEP